MALGPYVRERLTLDGEVEAGASGLGHYGLCWPSSSKQMIAWQPFCRAECRAGARDHSQGVTDGIPRQSGAADHSVQIETTIPGCCE